MGYGKTDYHPDSLPTIFQEVTLPVINPEQNHAYLTSIGYKYNQYDVIAGTTGGIEKMPLPGDGGGPLLQLIKGEWVLIGVFKSGIVNPDIMQDQYPTLFTSVFKNREWINRNIDRNYEIINQKLAIQKYFSQIFDYETHHFTTNTTRREVRDFVESEVKKMFHKPFTLKIINADGKVVNDSKLVEDGDWFDFEFTSLWFNTKFRYMAKNVGNKTTIQKKIKQIIAKFAKEIDVDEHQLSIGHSRLDAYQFVYNIVDQILNVEYVLQMKNLDVNQKIVNDASKYVWKGDWFDFILTVPGFGSWEFRFCAKNVMTDDSSADFFNFVMGYFQQSIPFNQHFLTTQNTYHEAKNWVSETIDRMNYGHFFDLGIVSPYDIFKIKMKNDDQKIGHGMSIKFNFRAYKYRGSFVVKFKNVGQDKNQGMLWDIVDYWNDNFKSLEHFSTTSNELELWDWIYLELNYKFANTHFKLRMLDYDLQRPLKRLVTYFFELEIQEYEYRLNLNLGKIQKDRIIQDNLQLFFDQEFLFHEHQLTTKNSRGDAQKLAWLWIKKITDKKILFILDDFDAKSNIINSSSLVQNGDWFDFKIEINEEIMSFRFKVKNVQARPGEGYILDVHDIFAWPIFAFQFEAMKSTWNYADVRKKMLEIIEDIFVSLPSTFSLLISADNLLALIGEGSKTFDFKIKIDNVTQKIRVHILDIPKLST